jgi:hypothetical protein
LEKVTIVVPIYKSELNQLELSSLKQVISVLGHFPITFVTYPNLDVKAYKEICGQKKVDLSYFDKRFFGNVWDYNKLLISKEFYTRFLSSEYILIYQLDAWVFRDELLEWCNKGYDYIGAPLYEGFGKAKEDSGFLGVGNGGLSLRKVKSYIKVLNSFAFIRSFKELKEKKYREGKTSKIQRIKLFLEYATANNTFHLFNDYDYNEDTFWGVIVSKKFKWFTVPDELTASRFSMELKAPFLYRTNKNTLPFGCHAWEKYHQDFWCEFIHIN